MLRKSVYVLLRVSGLIFFIFTSADIYKYRIYKSPNIFIGICLKNPVSVGL